MEKIIVETTKGYPPKGKYSQMIIGGQFLFLSGQLPFRTDGTLVVGDIKVQTRQVLENIKNMLEEAGSSLGKVLKMGVYIDNIMDFGAMNEVYSEYFQEQPPARTTLVVKEFPPGIMIEIDAIALL